MKRHADHAGFPAHLLRRLLAATVLLASCGPASSPELGGAILVVIDTLRADHLSSYGYEHPTSPEIDRLSREGVIFERVTSNASWTLPAMTALLSGRYPSAEVYAGSLQTSLVEVLRENHWNTVAFTEGGFASHHFGLDRGFATWREIAGPMRVLADSGRLATVHRKRSKEQFNSDIETTFGRLEAWLRANGSGSFFLLVHTYEVHRPYLRPPFGDTSLPAGLRAAMDESWYEKVNRHDFAFGEQEIAIVRSLYDGGVHTADAFVGGLRNTLDELDLSDTTLLVLTSDHGEDLADREPLRLGRHGHSLHRELTRIPLIIFDPRQRYPVQRVTTQVRIVDVLPTILDLLEIEPGRDVDGHSLLPLMRGEETSHRGAFAENRSSTNAGPTELSYVDYPNKLIAKYSPEGELLSADLYDLDADPREMRNVAEEQPEVLAHVSEKLRLLREELDEVGPALFMLPDKVPEALQRRLEGLGYIE
jgi:arylsulfatase A-like enzyme